MCVALLIKGQEGLGLFEFELNFLFWDFWQTFVSLVKDTNLEENDDYR